MNIFDGINPEQIQQLLAMGQDQGLGMEQEQPSLWNGSGDTDQSYNTGAIPEPPNFSDSDVSGFANSGMQSPSLPDPTQQIRGLMGNVIGANVASGQQRPPIYQAPKGGLMAYLASLGGYNG